MLNEAKWGWQALVRLLCFMTLVKSTYTILFFILIFGPFFPSHMFLKGTLMCYWRSTFYQLEYKKRCVTTLKSSYSRGLLEVISLHGFCCYLCVICRVWHTCDGRDIVCLSLTLFWRYGMYQSSIQHLYFPLGSRIKNKKDTGRIQGL